MVSNHSLQTRSNRQGRPRPAGNSSILLNFQEMYTKLKDILMIVTEQPAAVENFAYFYIQKY